MVPQGCLVYAGRCFAGSCASVGAATRLAAAQSAAGFGILRASHENLYYKSVHSLCVKLLLAPLAGSVVPVLKALAILLVLVHDPLIQHSMSRRMHGAFTM